ncbi:HK97 family phage prohead protease [Pseudonocardia nigra]|uniref:HK97 family phage prohead protease n=1 Tax=Pseudonocardia nigra TaxID=1921578 RepID=UPI0027E24667|nr:HK97 family phage prohead protease [Pseudonocardia nigra]
MATLGVVDSDQDVILPGAFTEGEPVVVSAYGHQSWSGALPVGAGEIHTRGDEAIFTGRFFLDTTAGKDTFAVVKALGAAQAWSFGFDVVDEQHGEHSGQRVRFLKRLRTYEVSPVLRGAGVGVRTLAVKAAEDPVEAVVREFARFVEIGLAQDLARELAEIKHRVELADQRDRDRRDLLDIRNHLHRRN